ncbi:hypothetical protein EBR25_09645 [bacterium]|nr:hypothetical protein [bacterium]
MRAEIATRNAAGSFSGTCPHCNESILSNVCCGDEFSCSYCSGNIGVQNYGSVFLFVHAPVKILPRPRQAQIIDPETYQEY